MCSLCWSSYCFVIGGSVVKILIIFSIFVGRAVNVAAAREPSRPKSPWVPFPELISALSKILPQHDMSIVMKLQKDYRVSASDLLLWSLRHFFFCFFAEVFGSASSVSQEMKISRQQMIQKLRVIAGDKLLFQVIKSFREKLQVSLSTDFDLH